MKPVRLMLIALVAGSLLSGCAGTLPITVGGDCHNKTLPMLLDATDMKTLFHDMALELCTDKCADRQSCAPASCQNETGGRATVMVTDFADLQSLVPSQSGMLMGELMRGGLNSVCCYKIVQAEFAKYFKLSENGLVVLTRRATEVKKNEYQQPEAVVGTYTYLSNNKVLVFARKMDTETGTISKMVTRELTYSCGGSSVINYTVK
ncbi:FlgO family outer membrane protein [Geomonas anaerohicana]|uniref:FlgO domain-containing protein n=1 Tax=Geomonas anaerohicana TaxID=2798583 RepID=A0ABS0YJ69_9BACT|nr:FlgO family outer membrane protein [Geomonas anaerohicana]MBJ6752408.1 hypothetical protein [Geomonas anaerohicana]